MKIITKTFPHAFFVTGITNFSAAVMLITLNACKHRGAIALPGITNNEAGLLALVGLIAGLEYKQFYVMLVFASISYFMISESQIFI